MLPRLRRRVHFLLAIVVLCLFFTSVSNVALWRHFAQVVAASDVSTAFVITVPLAIWALLTAIFTILFSWPYVLKVACSILLLSCAVATYGAWNYGIIFDRDMLNNFAQTNVAEATSYLSVSSVVSFLVIGVLPTIVLWRIKIYYPRPLRSIIERVVMVVGALAVSVALILPFFQQYVFIGRNNPTLQKEILPCSYVHAMWRYVGDKYFTAPTPYVALGQDARLASTTTKPKLMVMVVGETARMQNYSALGYHRPTNQYTDQKGMINFADVASCGTYTAYSLPCMFSDLTREQYSEKKAENREGVLDVLHKAGVAVTWIDNDSGCKGVCDRVHHITVDAKSNKQYCNGQTCFDEVFLDYVEDLSKDVTQDTLLVLHFIGSHGPRYYERYPEKFRVYTPDCNSPDVENCSTEELVNAYDNTIGYTDYVISKVIDILETRQESNEVMLLYVSDHGESLGENNIYLHAAPYAFAPKEQTRVPMQLWLPEKSAQAIGIDTTCLRKYALGGGASIFSHDNLFHMLLSLMQVQSSEYDANLDVFQRCRVAIAE